MRSFSMVASALGDRFRVRLRIAGDTAFTDGELVVLPQLPEGSEYTEAAWGYLVHEAAHLRFTDFELANRRCIEMPDLYRHIWNIFEDLRIEPALAALYPGVPRMINNVIARVIQDGVFKAVSPESHPARVLAGYLLYAGRCDVVGQSLLSGIAAETEKSLEEVLPSIAADVKRVLSKVSSAMSTADTLALADEIFSLLDQVPPQQPPPEGVGTERALDSGDAEHSDAQKAGDEGTNDSCGDGDPTGDSARSDDSGHSSDAGGSGKNDEDAERLAAAEPSGRRGDQGDQRGDDVANGNDADEGRGDGDDGAAASRHAAAASSESDETTPGPGDPAASSGAESNIAERAKAYSQGADGSIHSDLGDVIADALNQAKEGGGVNAQAGLTLEEVIRIVETDPVVDSNAEGMFVDARSHSFPLRRSLISLLESRARVNRWCVEQGRRVKTNRLSRLRTGDARIFEKRFAKKAINTAITLLLDSSSSMRVNDRMRLAKEACVALSLAIEAMRGVALEVLTFPYASTSSGRSGFGLAKEFKEKTAVMKKRFSRIASSGGTPMAPAIVTAGVRLLRRPEPRKVMLVLTDGEPESLELTHLAIETMQGIEMVGLGIESAEVARVFEHFVVIETVAELPRALLAKARELLAA